MDTISNIYQVLDARKNAFTSSLRRQGLSLPSLEFLRTAVTRIGDNTLAFSDPDAPEPEDIDRTTMEATFTITTPARDRYGDIVMPQGCLKTLDQYLRNPVVFFGHHSTDLPIALSLPPTITDAGIRATAKFHGETAESQCVFGLVANKILRATSIGFLPQKASIIADEEDDDGDTGRPKKTPEGEKVVYFDGWFPLRFLEWTLLEFSIVSVPANPECVDCLTHALSRGKIDDVAIPASIQKTLAPFALKARVWCHGFDPSREKYTGTLAMGGSELEYDAGSLTRIDTFSLKKEEEKPDATPSQPVPPGTMLIDCGKSLIIPELAGCARCGETHTDLTFSPLARTSNEWTHWAPCPTNSEPILLLIDDAKEEKEVPTTTPDPDPDPEPDPNGHVTRCLTEIKDICCCVRDCLAQHCEDSRQAHAVTSAAIATLCMPSKQEAIVVAPIPVGPSIVETKMVEMLSHMSKTQDALQHAIFRATGYKAK